MPELDSQVELLIGANVPRLCNLEKLFLPLMEVRMQHELKGKFLKDAGFREDCVTSLEDVIKDDFAGKIPDCDLKRTDGRLWYIPHHGAYHHKKPEKLGVVFDCSAKLRGASLKCYYDEIFIFLFQPFFSKMWNTDAN